MAGLKELLTILTVVAQNAWEDKTKAFRQKISPIEKKKVASTQLKEFLKDWLDWAEGKDYRYPHNIRSGLCLDVSTVDSSLKYELTNLFEFEVWPFGKTEYCNCARQGAQHKDPNRLAWVRAALNDTLDEWRLQ